MVHGHRIVRWGRLNGYWKPNSLVELGRVRYWVRERVGEGCTGQGSQRGGSMREIEGENGNEHLMENSCTLLYDYIEWTRTLVVFLDSVVVTLLSIRVHLWSLGCCEHAYR